MTRVLSALLLLPIVLGTVWFLPAEWTVALATAASVLAFFEFAHIAAQLGAPVPRATVLLVGLACAVAGSGRLPLDAVLLAALLAVGTMAVVRGEPGPGALPSAGAAMFAVFYVGVALGTVAAVHMYGGREALVLLMGTIVVSDSAQYYTGRTFGRVPLAPSISPKKTREGAIGGVLFGSAAMIAGGVYVFGRTQIGNVVVMSVAVVLAGIVGDLFESLLKRSAGIKDSSALIPGHGGILDRIDSWLFAGPVFYVFLRYVLFK